ncbi:MAG: hypothetical protein R2685_08100 [Candidatus Nitrosocosmicus sp.]|nr:hypothetical protein [Candidatus Nitrosocosmicus sp.]
MTPKSFLERLKMVEENTKALEQQREEWDLESELAEYRLKKYSTEIPKFGGVRD